LPRREIDRSRELRLDLMPDLLQRFVPGLRGHSDPFQPRAHHRRDCQSRHDRLLRPG
jgi:hypothetical protein